MFSTDFIFRQQENLATWLYLQQSIETNDATEQLQSVVANIGSRLSDVESMVSGFQNNIDDMNKNIANLFKVVYIWSKILLDHVIYLKRRKIYDC